MHKHSLNLGKQFSTPFFGFGWAPKNRLRVGIESPESILESNRKNFRSLGERLWHNWRRGQPREIDSGEDSFVWSRLHTSPSLPKPPPPPMAIKIVCPGGDGKCRGEHPPLDVFQFLFFFSLLLLHTLSLFSFRVFYFGH